MQHSSPVGHRRSAKQSRTRFAAAFSLLALVATGVLGACEPEAAPFCLGGYIPPDSPTTCEGKCTPGSCLDGNTCVGNRCVLTCASHADCLADGTQDCLPAVEDDTKAAIFTCQKNEKPYGWGLICPFGSECGTFHSCKDTGTFCDLTACGGKPEECKLDEAYCRNRVDCIVGKCHDGTGCNVLTCPAADCTTPLSCFSTGLGDANSYCTKQDCQADSECPGGYYCGVTRDPHGICGSMNPAKGDNTLCGTTSDPCVNQADIGTTDSTFEGQLCILRKTCIKRDTCAPCESDLDCSQVPNSLCITLPKEATKRCAPTCKTNADCGPSYECLPADAAAPNGPKACHHRFGACVGTGQFCEPCVNDTDCGPLTGSSICLEASDGSRGCFDLKVGSLACSTNAECPTAPNGVHGECAGGTCAPWPPSGGKGSCW